MSLFQSLEEAVGQGATQGETAAPAGVLAAIVQMVQSQPGGVGGILQKFQSAGLGGVAQSWVSSAANEPVAGEQVQSALGSGPVEQVASQLGVSPGAAASHIAQFLPLILDHLSLGGQAPAGDASGALQGVLTKFGL